ncbi:hypothetical protein ASD86_14080 [Lysobacter sp. Root690]|nr:hypothetical protein ASD86_14080 [Lysobacter sp. Root690]
MFQRGARQLCAGATVIEFDAFAIEDPDGCVGLRVNRVQTGGQLVVYGVAGAFGDVAAEAVSI